MKSTVWCGNTTVQDTVLQGLADEDVVQTTTDK